MALKGDAVNDHISQSTGFSSTLIATSYTWSMFIRNAANAADATPTKHPFTLVNAAGTFEMGFVWQDDDATKWKSAYHIDSGAAVDRAQMTTTPLANTKYHLCGIYNGTTLKVYLDGVEDATTAASNLATGETIRLSLFSYKFGTSGFDDSEISDFALWGTALSTDEAAALADGWSARLIRPQSRILYMPLVREIQDFHGSALTTVGTTVTDMTGVVYGGASKIMRYATNGSDWSGQTIAASWSTPMVMTAGSDEPFGFDTNIEFGTEFSPDTAFGRLTDGIRFRSRFSGNSGILAGGRRKVRPDG